MRVLLIDQDTELLRHLREPLTRDGVELDAHHTGSGATTRALDGAYRLVVLDATLPDVSGLEVLRQIRSRSSVPVILLTAADNDVDRVVGLTLGADDHLRKPFPARALLVRVQALLRRGVVSTAGGVGRIVRVDDVQLDTASRSVWRAGVPVAVTATEFDVLCALVQSAGRTVARETIVEEVLGRRFGPLDRSVDRHISRLRRKLGRRMAGDDRITTVRGVGYLYRVYTT